MSDLIFRKGNKSNLPSQLTDGTFYLIEDTKELKINDCVWEDTNQVKESILSSSYVSISYNDLKNKRDNNLLTPNALYCINDYEATTLQTETRAINSCIFYIIVKALGKNALSEIAYAIPTENTLLVNKIIPTAWEIKYSLDNDSTRFLWADSVNGKGVIYYMKDNYNNIAWYDFKNIQFLRTQEWLTNNSWWNRYGLSADTYFYTFSRIENGIIIDDSLGTGSYACSDNYLGHSTTVIPKLNNTIFIGNGNYNNKIGDGHLNNTFGSNTWNNNIDSNFSNNIIYGNFQSNIIGNQFSKNNIKNNFVDNIIGSKCSSNNFNGKFRKNQITLGALSNNFSNISDCSFKNTFSNNNFEFTDVNGEVTNCHFGNNISWVSDFPNYMNKITIDDNVFQNNTSFYLSQTSTNKSENIYETISGSSNNEEIVIYKVNSSNYAILKKSYINDLSFNVYNLGDFSSSAEAEEAASNPNIACNKNIILMKYTVSSQNKNGIIKQQVGNLSTYQYITWDGINKKRQLQFIQLGATISLINKGSWEEYYVSPELVKENEEVTARALSKINNNVSDLKVTTEENFINLSSGLSEVLTSIQNIEHHIYDLGDFTEWKEMLSAAANLANDNTINLMYFTFKNWNKSGVIEQQVSDKKTLQTLKWDNCETLRYITFADGNRTTPQNPTLDFKGRRTMPTEIYYKSGEKKLSLRQKGNDETYIVGLDNNADFGTVVLPDANATTYSVVKLDSDYTLATVNTAFSLSGANQLYVSISGDINEIKEIIEEDEQVIATSLVDLNQKYDNINNITSANTEIINTITQTVDENIININKLSGDVNNNINQINTLNDNVQLNTNDINSLNEEISVISQKVDENEKVTAKALVKLNNEVTNNKSDLDEFKEIVNNQLGDINTILEAIING